ncbi:unnamed protein product [Penicillium olsonii]|nr:unnamed protein product [Penicillium olsonii]CAG7923462.1 unnamed protein product [Penicillium olsonii]
MLILSQEHSSPHWKSMNVFSTHRLELTYLSGGSAGAVYAFIFAWTGTACCFSVLAELSSMAPTSGGQYHWCAMLAPIRHQKFLSYITGWIAVIGWQTALAAAAHLAGTEIQGVAILVYDNYDPKAWQGTLIMWASLFVGIAVNLKGGKLLPRLEQGILVLHILGCLAIIIPMTVLADHNSTREVFTEFLNGGEWPTQGLSWFVGLSGCAFSFAGGDSVVHMAEEIHNAAIVLPRAMMLCVLINGILGFGMLISLLFCMGDIQDALSTRTGYPFIEIFFHSTGSTVGAVLMSTIVLVISMFGVMGMLAAASRQFWSFSRDRAVPGWRVWSKVLPSNRIPIYSILLITTVAWLLCLINIGSEVALQDILSIAVSAIYLSYLMVGSLLLYRRCKGQISTYNDSDGAINVPGAKLVWGPFRVPGLIGTVINAYAVVYMIIVIFFSFWPPHIAPTVTTMNFSVVGTFGTIILAIAYYLLRARHFYTGPVLETTS